MNSRGYIIGALLIAAFVCMGASEMMRSQMPYYENVSEIRSASKGSVVQFIGAIVPGKTSFDAAKADLRFVLKDTKGETLSVRFNGARPSGFDTAPKLLVKGTYNGTEFAADSIQTKCPSKYEGR